jgi:hypothetical protein
MFVEDPALNSDDGGGFAFENGQTSGARIADYH